MKQVYCISMLHVMLTKPYEAGLQMRMMKGRESKQFVHIYRAVTQRSRIQGHFSSQTVSPLPLTSTVRVSKLPHYSSTDHPHLYARDSLLGL